MTSYIFDDNSIESKVLQFELIGKDVKVIKVGKYDLKEWLSNISDKDITKVYLHFCYEDFVTSTKDIRADISTALHKNPNLRIISQYENMDRSSLERRAKNYNISVDKFKAIKHTEIASDIIKPEPLGGHETPSEDFIKTLQEVHKDKIKTIDYAKYSVGGETKEVPPKPPQFIPHDDPESYRDKFSHMFSNKSEDKRRRKKKE